MHESHLRILRVLDAEKHLTSKQITKVLYPNEGQRAYERVAKALQSLRGQNLLSSKSYGVLAGKGGLDYFWALKSHPVIKDLGLTPPKGEVHSHFYPHEKLCGDVFVQLVLTGNLHGWEHKRLNDDIKPDRTFYYGDDLVFLEAERGSHNESTIRQKIQNYQQHWRETKARFKVLFVSRTDQHYQMIARNLSHPAYTVIHIDDLAIAFHSNTDSITGSEPVEQFG